MTTPLGENPYLYKDGPTVPLRQQRTGAYAANTFGNRVIYTPPGRLPNTTLAPGMAPTAGQIAARNLTGAGPVGAVIGSAVGAGIANSQGAGPFQSIGVGVGSTIGAIGGQIGGTAAGSAAGGAVGSAVPVVGNVSGAGAGAVVGGVTGGIAGGYAGGAAGGNIGTVLDNYFFPPPTAVQGNLGPGISQGTFGWKDPAQPAIGISTPIGQQGPIANPEQYPNQFPVEGAGAGPVVVPGVEDEEESLFEGGQGEGVLYTVAVQVKASNCFCDSGSPEPNFGNIFATRTGNFVGPINNVFSEVVTTGCQGRPWQYVLKVAHGNNLESTLFGPAGTAYPSTLYLCSEPIASVTVTRADGQANTEEDAPVKVPIERAPNPARNPNQPSRTLPENYTLPYPLTDRPWPQREAEPVPFTSPDFPPVETPNFAPTGDPLAPTEPAEAPTPTQPRPPFDPTAPTNPDEPGPPFEEETRPPFPPPFMPIPPPMAPVNPIPFVTPDLPVQVPTGFVPPATTPTGSPGRLINPTTTPNPNVQPKPDPQPQAPRIEEGEGKCCIPPTDQNLVRLLEQIKKGIGVDGLPANVPDQIAKDNPAQINVASLAELHLWQVKQLDGVMGRWPQQIPIPTPAGPVNVGMPNMAEAVAEMVGMMVSQQITATQILNTSSRALVQAGSATQQAHMAHLVAKANAEFLGYDARPTQVDMPLTYTPGLEPFEGLLNESTQKIKGFENSDGQDLKQVLAELLQAAAIIRAVFWRKLDPRGDLKAQIETNIRGQTGFMDEATAAGDDSDWEAYLRQVEEGFRRQTGDDTPYNRNPEEGPQIRDRSPNKDGE